MRTKEDVIQAIKISQTLKSGLLFSEEGQSYFLLPNINMPADESDDQSLAERIESTYGK